MTAGGMRPVATLSRVLSLLARVPGLAWLVVSSQILLWFFKKPTFFFMESWPLPARVASLLVAIGTTILFFSWATVVSGQHRRAGALLRYLLAGCYGALLFFRMNAETSLDFYLLAENLEILFYRESLALLASRISLDSWLILLNVFLLGVLADLFLPGKGICSEPNVVWRRVVIRSVLLVGVVLSPAYYHNDLSYILRTGLEYGFGRYTYPGVATVTGYPYVHEAVDSTDDLAVAPADSGDFPPMPHVFIVQMESFAADYVGAKTESGREITPVFNALIREGVYVERFYGNSIQSCRGQLATWCSILPSIQDKVFTHYPGLRVKSLAHILGSAGYRTIFFKAYKTLDFDRTGPFVRHIGFNETFAMDDRFVTREDQDFIWGWGIQDDRFYQKVFRYLDDTSKDALNKPCFVCMHTVSHHVPFCDMPPTHRILYPDAVDQRQHFCNSMALADRYLAEFFSQLRRRPRFANSIVIVTGDHGFPTGQHGSFYNEQGFWEENFRTPFLLLWPGHVEPKVIRKRAYSQIDIAPTILDLVGIEADNNFLGRSVLADSGCRPVHLIQPYCGGYLCVVDYPLKYVRAMRTPEEYLFDLEDDPAESRNLVEQYRDTSCLNALQREVETIYRNQLLIEHDRIWPPDKPVDDIVRHRAIE
ncbi:MAG: sulfatase-like hydrolase/transferase [Planctomycetia bacterium]|nr:sulfatase-like hydrolase/transferase [Planctomycetia bacterium]